MVPYFTQLYGLNLGTGVVIEDGDIQSYVDDNEKDYLKIVAGTTIIIHDLPVVKFEELKEKIAENFEINPTPSWLESGESVKSEKRRLQQRIDVINSIELVDKLVESNKMLTVG